MIKAIIFDLDDTLFPEKEYILSAFKIVGVYISEKCNVPNKVVDDLIKSLFLESHDKVFDRLLEDNRFSKLSVKELIQVYRNHFPDIKLFNEVKKVLTDLKVKGYKLGLITDGYRKSQKNKILSLGLNKYFDEIILTDELGKEYWKPNPRAFKIMKEKLNVKYRQMVYVGDNPQKDFFISNVFPIKTIRVYRNGIYNNYNYYKGIKENIAIKNLLDIHKAIYRIDSTKEDSNE